MVVGPWDGPTRPFPPIDYRRSFAPADAEAHPAGHTPEQAGATPNPVPCLSPPKDDRPGPIGAGLRGHRDAVRPQRAGNRLRFSIAPDRDAHRPNLQTAK